MGSEMGNNNVSSLHVENNAPVEAEQKPVGEVLKVDDVNGGNHIVASSDDTDFHEKVEGLASSNETGTADFEVEVLTDQSSEPPVRSVDADLKEQPYIDNNPSEAIDEQGQAQSSVKQEEKGSPSTWDAESESNQPQPLEPTDVKPTQIENPSVEAAPSVEEDHGLPLQQNKQIEGSKGNKQVQRISSTCTTEEKDQVLDSKIDNQFDQIVNSDSECKWDVKEMSLHDVVNDFEITLDKSDTDLATKLNPQAGPGLTSSSLETLQEEVLLSGDKCVVLTEESKQLGSESQSEERLDINPAKSCEKLIEISKIDELNDLASIDTRPNSVSEEQAKAFETRQFQEVEKFLSESTVIKDAVYEAADNLNEKKVGQETEEKNAKAFDSSSPTMLETDTQPIEEASMLVSEQEIMGRCSTDTIDQNPSTHVIERRKSPSFDFDLPLDSRTHESDQTPLLYHDKAVTRSLQSNENPPKNDPVQSGEKCVKMEKSDSKKLRSPFFSFLKEGEDTQVLLTPQKQNTHVAACAKKAEEQDISDSSTERTSKTSSKRQEKRKYKSSFFSTCICCAAVIN